MHAIAERPPATSNLRRRRLGWLLGLVILLAAATLASIALGARPMSLSEIADGILHGGQSDTAIIIRSMRVPRTVLGIVAGIALGIAGALIQGHTRNPLADPGLLGVSAGAAFAVVIAIYVLRITTPFQFLWFAFAGAAIASIVVFGLASVGAGRSSPLSLILAGAAVSAFLAAITSAVVLLDETSLDQMRFWVVGSIARPNYGIIWTVLPFIAIGVVLAIASSPGLNILSLGDDVAQALGTNVAATRITGIVAITLLTGAATAACGPIAFLGLVVPHVVRGFTGPDYRWIIPCSGLLGAVLLLAADTLGRVVARPGEIQVSIILALVGAPFFIALVRRRKLAAL